jgi:hypothetical protein
MDMEHYLSTLRRYTNAAPLATICQSCSTKPPWDYSSTPSSKPSQSTRVHMGPLGELHQQQVYCYACYSTASCLQCPHSTNAPLAFCSSLCPEQICLDLAATIHLLEPIRATPAGNGARITGEVLRSNELPNVFFLDRTSLETLQANSL